MRSSAEVVDSSVEVVGTSAEVVGEVSIVVIGAYIRLVHQTSSYFIYITSAEDQYPDHGDNETSNRNGQFSMTKQSRSMNRCRPFILGLPHPVQSFFNLRVWGTIARRKPVVSANEDILSTLILIVCSK